MTASKQQHPSVDNDTQEDTTLQSVGNTVGTFAHRLQRKLKEQQVQQSESDKLRESRHALIYQAMTTIRKALAETGKIKLGDRFRFRLQVSDWEGWPKVELLLVDSVAPERVDYFLEVTANDRNDLGTILIKTNGKEVLGRLQLHDPREFKRLPVILKRAVRQYLDVIAAYVLNPKKPEELLEVQAKNLEEEAPVDRVSSALQGANVFAEEDNFASDNLVEEESGEDVPLALSPDFS